MMALTFESAYLFTELLLVALGRIALTTPFLSLAERATARFCSRKLWVEWPAI
jgi:hypothetical protein